MPSGQDLADQLEAFNETLPIMWSKKVGSGKRGATQNVHVTTISFHNVDKVWKGFPWIGPLLDALAPFLHKMRLILYHNITHGTCHMTAMHGDHKYDNETTQTWMLTVGESNKLCASTARARTKQEVTIKLENGSFVVMNNVGTGADNGPNKHQIRGNGNSLTFIFYTNAPPENQSANGFGSTRTVVKRPSG
jgi:hypothetical protein